MSTHEHVGTDNQPLLDEIDKILRRYFLGRGYYLHSGVYMSDEKSNLACRNAAIEITNLTRGGK